MRSEDGLMGTVVIRLMALGGRSCRGRDEQVLTGQEERGRGRKLPFNQNGEFILAQVAPDLVRRSAGLLGPGHQNQSAGVDTEEISRSLVP